MSEADILNISTPLAMVEAGNLRPYEMFIGWRKTQLQGPAVGPCWRCCDWLRHEGEVHRGNFSV